MNENDILLYNLDGHKIRNIAILFTETVFKNGKKFLLLLGVDIFTQKIVKLVDNYGKQYGLCKYSEDFKNIGYKSVIKIPCEICNEYRNINTLRITGQITVLGKTDFQKLLNKYFYLNPFDYVPHSKKFQFLTF